MKFFSHNRTLGYAFAVSAALHGVLLAVRFVAPDSFKFKPTDPGLEVILVNSKHEKAPLKADALAQANLDGGGNADAGRAKSPLPDMRRNEDGDNVKEANRRAAELEEMKQALLAQLNKKNSFTAHQAQRPELRQEVQQLDAADDMENAKAIARREAEIAKDISDYNKRPRKTQITPSTTAVGYAMYYKALQHRVEKIGTLNFPKANGKKLYGSLIVYIPIFQDGTLYMAEGGPRVEGSSGNMALDRAALDIVRRSAPFGKFPPNMRSTDKTDVWEVISRFKFTDEDGLETELRGGQ